MHESGLALEQAANDDASGTASIAAQILTDPKKLRSWEANHARLLEPVAEHRRRKAQIMELRCLDTRLLQQSSLIRFIRSSGVTGETRERLFSIFYGPKDTVDAILTEHRRFLLAKSSQFSVDHLLHLMHDSTGDRLLKLYASAYANYFSLYCHFRCNDGSIMGEAVGPAMIDARKCVERLRERLLREEPKPSHLSFDDEALLAESGRYEALNYLNR